MLKEEVETPPNKLKYIGGYIMQYVYPAIFYEAKDGGYVVEFPDVQGAVTQGETLYEAMVMAEDALAGMLACYEDKKAGILDHPFTNKVNKPTPISQIKAEPDEFSNGAFVTLIRVDTDEYRKSLVNRGLHEEHEAIPA